MRPIDNIEPYTLRLTLEGEDPDPERTIATLLTDVAERCQDAGGPLVGHIKCYASTASGSFHCSLTSLRTGAQCSALPVAAGPRSGRIDVDLAVLVYGLERETIDGLTRASLDALCRAAGATWTVRSSSAAHSHTDSAASESV